MTCLQGSLTVGAACSTMMVLLGLVESGVGDERGGETGFWDFFRSGTLVKVHLANPTS